MNYSLEPEHKKRLRINRPFIVENLICLDEVLDHLLSGEVLSGSIVDNIRQRNVPERQKIRSTLDALDKKTSDKFDKFCSILDDTNNELVATKLRNPASAPPRSLPLLRPPVLAPKILGKTSDEDRNVFQRLRVEFVENMLDVEGVVDSLMSQELLNQAHRSMIFQNNDRRQQVRKIIDILPKKGPAALPSLLTALKASGNDHLHETIMNYKSKHSK